VCRLRPGKHEGTDGSASMTARFSCWALVGLEITLFLAYIGLFPSMFPRLTTSVCNA
jgi:hypothetical protein